MAYVIHVCGQLASGIRMELACEQDQGVICHSDLARKLSANLYNIYRCCVYSEKLLMMDR